MKTKERPDKPFNVCIGTIQSTHVSFFLDTRYYFYFFISGLYQGSKKNNKCSSTWAYKYKQWPMKAWTHLRSEEIVAKIFRKCDDSEILRNIFWKYCKNIPKIFSDPGAWWPGGATAASWWAPRSSASRFMIITILKQDYNIHQVFYLYNIKTKLW